MLRLWQSLQTASGIKELPEGPNLPAPQPPLPVHHHRRGAAPTPNMRAQAFPMILFQNKFFFVKPKDSKVGGETRGDMTRFLLTSLNVVKLGKLPGGQSNRAKD